MCSSVVSTVAVPSNLLATYPRPRAPPGGSSPSSANSAATSTNRSMLGSETERLEAREELRPEEHMDLSERFEILESLGGGAYGRVYRARDCAREGEVVALKMMSVREDPDIGIPPFVMREMANLKRLSAPENRKDPHIVRWVDNTSHTPYYVERIQLVLKKRVCTSMSELKCSSLRTDTAWGDTSPNRKRL